jgi:CheY-like chemotaxis protein
VTELRGDEKFAEIPIIGVTAKADIACRQECFVAGMNDFITKPFTAKEVYASLSHFFEMNEHID